MHYLNSHIILIFYFKHSMASNSRPVGSKPNLGPIGNRGFGSGNSLINRLAALLILIIKLSYKSSLNFCSISLFFCLFSIFSLLQFWFFISFKNLGSPVDHLEDRSHSQRSTPMDQHRRISPTHDTGVQTRGGNRYVVLTFMSYCHWDSRYIFKIYLVTYSQV